MFTCFIIVLLTSAVGDGTRIYAGKEAENGQFPFMALLFGRSKIYVDHYSTGTIISDRWVLATIYSVVFSNTSDGIAKAEDITIYYGVALFDSLDLHNYMECNVSKILTKKQSETTSEYEQGAALLKTSSKLDINHKYVGVAKILTHSPYGKVSGIVLGFGNDLICSDIKALTYYDDIKCNYYCRDIPDNFVKAQYDSEYYFCPRGDGIAHFNRGDDGAPLLLGKNHAVCGLVHNYSAFEIKEHGYTMVYLRLHFYLDWIKKHVPEATFVDEWTQE